jgi:hypothetical protein
MENEWEREKQKILNALLGSGQDTIDFQPETEVILIDVYFHMINSNYITFRVHFTLMKYGNYEIICKNESHCCKSLITLFSELFCRVS